MKVSQFENSDSLPVTGFGKAVLNAAFAQKHRLKITKVY